jgi:uncharacterized protein YybS (DUF2232 family)
MNYRATLAAAAQASALFLSGFIIPLLGMAFTPVPIILVTVRQGKAEGLTALGIAAVVVGVIGGGNVAAFLLLCFGLMAIGTAEGLLRKWRAETTALVGGGLPSIAIALAAVRFFLVRGKNPAPYLDGLFQAQRDVAVKLYTDLKLKDMAAAVSAVPDSFLHSFVLVLPGIVVTLLVLLAAACSVLSVRLVLRKPGTGPVLVPTPLSSWHAPDVWVWGLILTLVLIMLPNEALKIMGWNFSILATLVYLMQGIAILEHYLKKAHIQPIIRGLIQAIILALPIVVCVIALGVVDIWADFRKVRGPVPPA